MHNSPSFAINPIYRKSGTLPFIFAPLTFHGSSEQLSLFNNDRHSEELEQYLKDNPQCAEAVSVQNLLQEIVHKSKEFYQLNQDYAHCYDDWFKQVFTFKDEHGYAKMKVIKLYDEANQSKTLIPVTMWTQNHSAIDHLFCVPLPDKKQLLYNLDLLANAENPIVILTDSVEIADLNQEKCSLENVIFTSFLCDPGQYQQVDFSPLKEAQEIYYLITNHSGSSMEAAYLKANEIAEYLREEETIELKFIQAPVTYRTARQFFFHNVGDILQNRREDKTQINTALILTLESSEDFNINYDKALAKINEDPLRWLESQNTEAQRLVEEEKSKKVPIDYVIHPILKRGEATMIYAGKSTGKSALAYSLAGIATSCSKRTPPLLKEKWWVSTQNNHGMHKVLYLDFENGKSVNDEWHDNFAVPYWSTDAVAKKKSNSNFIIKDMTAAKSGHTDYSNPANHQKLIDMINAAKNEGVPDQPVDLLVIDTLTKFIGMQTPSTPMNFGDLIDMLRKMNIAILILHHQNSDGDIRGLKSVIDNFYLNIQLYRNKDMADECCNLADPFKVKQKNPRKDFPKSLMAEFEICYIDNAWQVVNPPRTETAELKLLADFYKNAGYSREAIAQMLGMSKSTLQEKLKE